MRTAVLVAFVFSSFMSTPAFAADISSGGSEGCQLRMEGQIVAGDATSIEAQLRHLESTTGTSTDAVLCVSGSGGSLTEALTIGTLLYDRGIRTRIEADQSCLSTCAVVFMMGTRFFEEGVGDGHNASRRMHVTSRLGFQKPEFKVEADGVFDAAAVETSIDEAVQTILAFLKLANLGSNPNVMVPSDLIENMFEHQGHDFYYIETTGQTSRWDIGLDGFEPPRSMGPRAAHTACSNLGIWQKRYEADAGIYNDGDALMVDQSTEGVVFKVNGAFQSDAAHECLIQLKSYPSGGVELNACGNLGRENLLIANKGCGNGIEELIYHSSDQLEYSYDFDARALLPPATELSRANAEAREIEARAQDFLASQTPSHNNGQQHRSCGALDGLVQVTNVKNFVNMRSDTNFNASVVAEVALGAELRPADGAIYRTSDEQASGDRCAHLCSSAQKNALAGTEVDELEQCFQSNYFWYKLHTSQGQTGFVSAKYLE